MAMHEIESLIECSVRTIATASSIPPLARSICFSLYQLQDKFDCGYTVLRVREELVRLGYLYLLPPEQLPEPERSEALKLTKEGGFFDEETYLDYRSGVCCVTAGSKLWRKLLALGILPEGDNENVHYLSPLELMEVIVPLASELSAKGDHTGIDTLGLWYGLFPVVCLVVGYDGGLEAERLRCLLRLLAVPEAFKAAEKYIREVDFDDFGDDEELPFGTEWGAPYKAWKEKEEDKSLFPEFCKCMMYEFMDKKEFAEADRYASYTGKEDDSVRLLHRGMVSVACHQWLRTQVQETIPPEGLLSLTEAKAGFEYLAGLELPDQERALCRLYVVQILELQGEYLAVIETLQQMYSEAVAIVARRQDNNTKRMQQAILAVSYYQMLHESLPDDYVPKKEAMRRGLPELMDLNTACRMCSELLPEMPQMADTLQQNIEKCKQLMLYLQESET